MTWRRALVVALFVGIFGPYWFYGHYYPALGLWGYAESDYTAALERAARGFGQSRGLRLAGLGQARLVRTGFDDSAYAWGVADLAPDGETVGDPLRLWVCLSKKGGNAPWVRWEVSLLADPAEDPLGGRSRCFGLDQGLLRLKLGLGELARRVVEATRPAVGS